MRPLDIVVCLKSVPDPKAVGAVSLDPRTLAIRKEGVPRVISPLDKNALEEALRFREQRGGTVRVVSMGSPSALDVLRETLAIGADEVLFISDPACVGADTLATARVLAAAIRRLERFDLIFCGDRSFYGSTGQVGPQLAEFLAVPHVSHVQEMSFVGEEEVALRSRIENGYVELETAIPLLVSVVKEINTLRGISMLGIVRARAKPVRTMTVADLGLSPSEVGLAGSATRMIMINAPSGKREGRLLGGSPDEAVAALVSELRKSGSLPMLGTKAGGEH